MYKTPSSKADSSRVSHVGGLLNLILIISLMLTVIYWLLPYIEHRWMSQSELMIMSYSGFSSKVQLPNWFYWSLGAVWCLINIGLIYRKRFCRKLFVIMMIIAFIMVLFDGYGVEPPWSLFIGNVLGFLDGMILVMIYLTSAANEFD